MKRAYLAVLVLAIAAGEAGAQRLADLAPGTAVRVRLLEERAQWRKGTLDMLTDASLQLRQADHRLVVARQQLNTVQRRDVDASRWDRAITGGLVGALIGTATVGGMVYLCGIHHEPECGLGLILVPPAALLGAITGGALNASRSIERWKTVELP